MIVAADRDAMYTVSDEIKQIDNDLKRIQFAIEQLIYSTYADWQGESERAFAEKIIVINEGMDSLVFKSLVEISGKTVSSVSAPKTEEHLVSECIGK